MMPHPRTFALLLLLLGPAALLAGCGGGGGGGTTNNGGGGGGGSQTGTVTGKVVDQAGTPVPAGVIFVDGVQQNAITPSGGTGIVGGATFSQGGYRLEGVPAGADQGFHIITAQAANGETGSTQVFVYSSSFATTNANIVVSPANQQATLSGNVTAGDDSRRLAGARVYLRCPVTPTASNPSGYASLIAYTRPDGTYDISNVPVQNADGTPRTYTPAAAFLSTQDARVYDNVIQAGRTFSTGTNPALNFVVPLHSGGYTTTPTDPFTPTITLLESFTQPNVPSVGPAAVARAQPAAAGASSTAAFEQIHRLLSPAYARLSAARHTAAQSRLAARPSATASDYVVEMDLFFSLPGDTAGGTPDSPQRSMLYGFDVFNNNASQPVDALIDPQANFYDDPSLGATRYYAADSPYTFEVDSIGSDASSNLGQSNHVAVTPLEFVNLLHPADPNDTGGAVETLAGDTVQWNAVSRVQGYTVLVYGTFPGVSTTPLLTSGTLAGSATSYTIPAGSGLVSGQEYWVVVAATATGNAASSEAFSVSQITPFHAP